VVSDGTNLRCLGRVRCRLSGVRLDEGPDGHEPDRPVSPSTATHCFARVAISNPVACPVVWTAEVQSILMVVDFPSPVWSQERELLTRTVRHTVHLEPIEQTPTIERSVWAIGHRTSESMPASGRVRDCADG